MLERIFENRQAIIAATTDRSTNCEVQIDFDFVEQILEILRPFDFFTTLLSSRSACISSVLPTYFALKEQLNNESSKSALLKKFSRTVLTGFESRMTDLENKP